MEPTMPTPSFADFYSVVGWPVMVMLAGALLSLVAGLWLVVAAFRESVLWGVCVLLVPFAALVFVFMKWSAAAKPFLLSLAALGVMGAGFVLAARNMQPDNPALMTLAEKYGITGQGTPLGDSGGVEGSGMPLPEPTPTRPPTREELRALQQELNESSASLLARKEALDPADAEAAARLTRDIETYNQRLSEFQHLREALKRASSGIAQAPAPSSEESHPEEPAAAP